MYEKKNARLYVCPRSKLEIILTRLLIFTFAGLNLLDVILARGRGMI